MEKRRQYLPTLLERLMDDEPKQKIEPWDKYHFDSRTMRRIIHQHIIEILNNANMERDLDLVKHQQIASSVLNFGLQPVTGTLSTPQRRVRLGERVREAIIRFEPRIIPESVVIHHQENGQEKAGNGVHFEIRALIYWSPHPIDLCIRAHFDVERDSAELTLIN